MVDKQKEWKRIGDKKSIREYNNWKQTNFRDTKGLLRVEKILTEKQQIERVRYKQWYLKNREQILKQYHALKPYTWIEINLEDREFCLNYNPKEFPKYLEEFEKKKLELLKIIKKS